jgi:hypothetical protein
MDGAGHMSFSDWPRFSTFRPAHEPTTGFGMGSLSADESAGRTSELLRRFLTANL